MMSAFPMLSGHIPPSLAGRNKKRPEFERLCEWGEYWTGLILTGLRGIDKMVLPETPKPFLKWSGWLWPCLSESSNLKDRRMDCRFLTCVSVVTFNNTVDIGIASFGLEKPAVEQIQPGFSCLSHLFQMVSRVVEDKLKEVLIRCQIHDIMFARDEAKVLHNHSSQNHYGRRSFADSLMERFNLPQPKEA